MGDPSLRATLLEHMDVQQRVEQAARVVSDYLSGGEGPDGIMATLGHALLREDSDFHSFQIVDAGFKQYRARRRSGAGRHVLVGMTRFLAAHSPTYRAVDQTHNIALRLHRGEELYRDHLGIILRPLVTLSPPAIYTCHPESSRRRAKGLGRRGPGHDSTSMIAPPPQQLS